MNDVEIDLKLLRTLFLLYQTRSYTLTAERLGRTQPAVSQQIRKLEESLGYELVSHKKGQVGFTSKGEMLARNSSEIFSRIKKLVGSLDHSPENVCIGIPEDIFLANMLREFDHDPEISTSFYVLPSRKLADYFERGQIDIVAVRSVKPLPNAVAAWRHPIYWGCRETNQEWREPIPVALLCPDCAYHDVALRALEGAGVAFRLQAVCSNWNQLTEVLALGGVTVISDYNRPLLVEVPAPVSLPPLPAMTLNVLVREQRVNDCRQTFTRFVDRLGASNTFGENHRLF